MKRKTLVGLILASSLISPAAFSATPAYEKVSVYITSDIGNGYSNTFYVPYDNNTHYFYFDQNDFSVKDTTDGNIFDKNTDANSTYFKFRQSRNPRIPDTDNTNTYIHYIDYNHGNCLVEHNFSGILYNSPSKTKTIPKSNCDGNKITYTINVSLN
ncbi:hypothetical protein [Serratia sp. Se-RSBMAAmG]|uniref:hypothetical protein n=1 Tax=Serratia sp. Se-RSBMAAmG TaxID=3043305 RepID=UPI0024AEA41A|nr:hypothetical protein [Serratia sp. Se-RSBMAAmG]MDI6977101.1 hypothetical protein [Serratia sp. Se-RSBMAAmG]